MKKEQSLWIALFYFKVLNACTCYNTDFTGYQVIQFLSFFIGSFGTAPTAYFFRNLMVKERSQIQIAAILISGITGVSCAYHGWGYWGIAVQTVVYVSTNTILLWIFSPWRPTFSFRFHPLLELLPFSSKLLFTSLVTHINSPHCWDVSTPSSKPVTTHREASGRRWDIPPFSE